jgi:ribosomal protein S18 acetylase RimI-like enzyme
VIAVRIRRLTADDVGVVLAAAELFDASPSRPATERFLREANHHLLVAFADDGAPVGFVSGVELTHPDKGTEMLLYELSVAERARRRGVGAALVRALAEEARARGCHGMFVLTDEGNAAAQATYRTAGAGAPTRHLMFEWPF